MINSDFRKILIVIQIRKGGGFGIIAQRFFLLLSENNAVNISLLHPQIYNKGFHRHYAEELGRFFYFC